MVGTFVVVVLVNLLGDLLFAGADHPSGLFGWRFALIAAVTISIMIGVIKLISSIVRQRRAICK